MTVRVHTLRSGTGRLAVRLVEGASSVTASDATDPLKLLVSTPRGRCAWAYTTTYGGGLLAGDRIHLSVDVEAGARLFLGTQASTKIYRSPEGLASSQHLSLRAGAGAVVVGLPDPVTPFADALHVQDQRLDLAADASLVWLDGVTSGRAARDERWLFTRHRSALRLTVGGTVKAIDAIDLAPGLRPVAERCDGVGAMATLLIGGPAFADRCATLSELVNGRDLDRLPLAAVCPLAGWGVLVRLAAAERESLERLVRELLGDLRPLIDDDPWERRP